MRSLRELMDDILVEGAGRGVGTQMEEVKRGLFDVSYVNCLSCEYCSEDGKTGGRYCYKGRVTFRPRKCSDFEHAEFFHRDFAYSIKVALTSPFRLVLWPFRKLTGWYEKIQEEAETKKESRKNLSGREI